MTRVNDLLGCYRTILLDVMGVLLDGGRAIPEAAAFVDHLNATGHDYYVLTNISSATNAGVRARLAEAGVPVRSARNVVSAGEASRAYLERNRPRGTRVACLGPEASRESLRGSWCRLVDHRAGADYDVLAILDDEGVAFRTEVERILSDWVRRHRDGRGLPTILVANPDAAYPSSERTGWHLGPGALVAMLTGPLEEILGVRPRVELIGKPGRHLFDECRARSRTDSLLMIGDQLATDVAGAKAAGVDAALVTTGLNRACDLAQAGAHRPDFVLDSLAV